MTLSALALFVLTTVRAVAGTTDEYRLGPGDVLKIEVIGQSFGGQYVVGTLGTLTFPYCEQVAVGGLSVAEAESALRACLLDGVLVDPQVSARIEEYHSQKVEIVGAVPKPGIVSLQGPTTLRTVLGLVGGVQSEQATGVVSVTRGEETFQIPISDLPGQAGDVRILAGDVVSVEEGQVVLVGGQVSKPGAISFNEGMTVREALLRAGGQTAVANLGASYVLRDGEKISVNLRRIQRGKAADLVLEPGDQLVVPESPI